MRSFCDDGGVRVPCGYFFWLGPLMGLWAMRFSSAFTKCCVDIFFRVLFAVLSVLRCVGVGGDGGVVLSLSLVMAASSLTLDCIGVGGG